MSLLNLRYSKTWHVATRALRDDLGPPVVNTLTTIVWGEHSFGTNVAETHATYSLPIQLNWSLVCVFIVKAAVIYFIIDYCFKRLKYMLKFLGSLWKKCYDENNID